MGTQQPKVGTTLSNGSDDLRPALRARLADLETLLSRLEQEDERLQVQLRETRNDAGVIRDMILVEDRRVGDAVPEPNNPDDYLLDVSLADIAEEFFQANLSKEDMLHRLQAVGYDFGESFPKRAIQGGWNGAMLRRQRELRNAKAVGS
jgi:hypothetical protein